MDELPADLPLEMDFHEELRYKPDENIETYSRLSSPDRDFLQRLKELPPLGSLPVAEERRRMRDGQTTSIDEYPVSLTQHATTDCIVYLIHRLNVSESEPTLFYLHGGGWVLGDLQTHLKLVCELALRIRCVVALIHYPLAPEHRFPAALDASVTAIEEMLASSESLGLDKNRFAIAGDSAGGNLAAAIILKLVKRNLPLPGRQVLLYPVTNCNFTTSSYEKFRENPNLSQAAMKWFWSHYLPEKSFSADPLVSPLQADETLLAKFPPTLLISCEYDVLRDEGEAFAVRLLHAGVEVTAVRWLGSLHGFLVNEFLSGSASARACIDMVAQYLRRGFEKD